MDKALAEMALLKLLQLIRVLKTRAGFRSSNALFHTTFLPDALQLQNHIFFPFFSFSSSFYQGTADAMRRCLWVLEEFPVSEFLILPGHHLYKMDYQKLIEAHRSSQADITIAALDYIKEPDPGFGLLKVNSENEVAEFILRSEKDPRIVTSVSYFHQYIFL